MAGRHSIVPVIAYPAQQKCLGLFLPGFVILAIGRKLRLDRLKQVLVQERFVLPGIALAPGRDLT